MQRIDCNNTAQLWWPLGMGKRDKRATELSDYLYEQDAKPQVVCLQEVWRSSAARIFKKLADDLGLESHWHRKAGLFTMVPPNDSNQFEDYLFTDHYDWPFTHKGFTVVDTPDALIVNTHLQAGFPRIIRNIFFRGVNFDNVKLKQLAQITDLLLPFDDQDIWVCGDLNLATNKPHEYDGAEALLGEGSLDLRDLLKDVKRQPAKRVDYIWGDPHVAILGRVDSTVMDDGLTDHPLVSIRKARRRRKRSKPVRCRKSKA